MLPIEFADGDGAELLPWPKVQETPLYFAVSNKGSITFKEEDFISLSGRNGGYKIRTLFLLVACGNNQFGIGSAGCTLQSCSFRGALALGATRCLFLLGTLSGSLRLHRIVKHPEPFISKK